ncbi:hypothetical protein FOZ62_024954, partial [Perkinsus olseni]
MPLYIVVTAFLRCMADGESVVFSPSVIAAMSLDKTLAELTEAEGDIQTTQPPTFNLAEVEGINLGPSLDVYGEPTTATTQPNEIMPKVDLSAIEGVSLDKVLLYPEVTTTAAPKAGTRPSRPKRDLTAEWGKKDIKDIKHLTDEQITEEILKSCRYMAANPETVKKSGLSSLPYNVQDTWELVHVVKKLVDNSIAQNQRLSGEEEDMKNELTKAHQEIIKRDEELARREGQERRKEEERERPALPSLDLEENIGRIGQQHGLDVFSAGR